MIKDREKDCLAIARRLALTGRFQDTAAIERELRFKRGRYDAGEFLDDDRIRSELDQACNHHRKAGNIRI